jgi:type VI protein secretion system component VasK
MLAVDYPLMNIFWSMLWFFLFFAWIAILVQVFADNFRRNDHSGWAKAGWTILIVFVPFLGVLAYMIARPKMTEQDKQMLAQVEEQQKRLQGYSAADEIAKLTKLRADGAISAEEFERMKQKAMV